MGNKQYELSELEKNTLEKDIPCKVGDSVWHIDSGNHLWEFTIEKIKGNVAFIISKDDLKCKSKFCIDKMPMPRLFYNKNEAECKLSELTATWEAKAIESCSFPMRYGPDTIFIKGHCYKCVSKGKDVIVEDENGNGMQFDTTLFNNTFIRK